jgi:serine/threonine protein kinase/tetratricopeptide (TPR) repeat protein
MIENIGPYEVVSLLGEGGMGVVYQAKHRETGELVALKTVKSSTESFVQNIRREINTLSRLKHPGIATLQTHGEERGLPWYAMTFIQGISLRALIRSSKTQTIEQHGSGSLSADDTSQHIPTAAWWTSGLSSEESAAFTSELYSEERMKSLSSRALDIRGALTFARSLCETLSYLHGEGFVHRDLKPDNVIITLDHQPVLVDFGLSTVTGTRESREEVTSIRNAAGSVFYIAPEQASSQLTDARADLYSLGCILFELIAGRPPFVAENQLAILRAHMADPAPLLSSMVDGIPSGLDRLLQRLLAKDPRQRIGYADSVAYYIDELLNEPGAPIQTNPYLYRPGFQGRQSESARIQNAIASLQQKKGGALFINGPSGLGKTRTALESIKGVRDIILLTGECTTSTAPLHPLRSSLERLADRCRERGAKETERVFGERGALLSMYEPSLLSLWETLPPLPPLPAKDAKQRLYRYLSETFAAVAAERPLLLLLDNLQWADALTRGWLTDWISQRAFTQAPILLVGLTSMPLRIQSQEEVEEVSLSPLSSSELALLVADMLAIESAPQSLVDVVYRVSGGNPYFAAAYLRTAVEEGRLQRDSLGQWRVDETTRLSDTFDALPQSVRDLLVQKIAALPAESLLVLQSVSLLEHRSVAAIKEVSQSSVSGLLQSFDVLQRAELIESDEAGCPRLVLESIREVALSWLSGEERVALYARAAQHAERLSAEERLIFAASIARYWMAANEPLRASDWFLQASRHAIARYAYEEAESCYRAYMGLLKAPTRESVTARKDFSDKVLFLLGRTHEAQQELEIAIEEAKQLGEQRLVAESLQTVGQVYWRLGQIERARLSCEGALLIARQIKARDIEGKLYNSLAVLEHEQGQSESAARHYEQAIAIHLERGDKAAEVVSVSNLAVLRHWQNKIPEAIQLFARALSLHQEAGSLRSAAMTELNFAAFWVSQKNYEEARRLIEHALQSFNTVGDKQLEALAKNTLGELVWKSGSPAEAEDLFRESLAVFEETQSLRSSGIALANLGFLMLVVHGDINTASEMLQSAQERLRQASDTIQLASCICRLGHVSLAQNQDAQRYVDEASALAQKFSQERSGDLGENIATLSRAQQLFLSGGSLVRGLSPTDFWQACKHTA